MCKLDIPSLSEYNNDKATRKAWYKMSKKAVSGRIRSRNEKLHRIMFISILLSFVLTLLFLLYRLLLTEFVDGLSSSGRSKAEYVMMAFECVIGLILLFLPGMVSKKLTLRLPSNFYIFYVIFIYSSIYLGEVFGFFYRFKAWDTILHSFSGFALGALGFSVVTFLNRDANVRLSLSPLFVALFSFCFALALGAVWEICEYAVDGIFGANMQKFALENGTQLMGRDALSDTMKDLIVDSIGALSASIAGYFAIKPRKITVKDN